MIPTGPLLGLGIVNSVIAPVGVIRPIPPMFCVNHRLPSGPAAIRFGPLFGVRPAVNSVTWPTGSPAPTGSAPHSKTTRATATPVMTRAVARARGSTMSQPFAPGFEADEIGEPAHAVDRFG